MPAAKYNIEIEQGSDFILGLSIKAANGLPYDLTGVTARGQIRKLVTDTEPIATFDITFDNNRKSGKITLYLPAATTTTLNFTVAVYDLEFISPTGIVKRIIQGTATLSPEVTR
jgi:hypothetical protein